MPLELPEDWRIGAEITPSRASDRATDEVMAFHEAKRPGFKENEKAKENDKDKVKAALASPVNAAPLHQQPLQGKHALVLIDDDTRPTPVHLLFPPVAAELQAASVGKITILVALGTHEKMSEEAIFTRAGIDGDHALEDQVTTVNHDCFDQTQLVAFGSDGEEEVYLNRAFADADLVVSIGTIEPHLLAGFGGGLKNIVPGCAGMESIAAVHLLGSCRYRYDNAGVIENPVRSRIESLALKFPGKYFLVNTVLDQEKDIVDVFCGDPLEAFRRGARMAGEVYGARVERTYDIVIANAYPMETDLRQGTKALAHGMKALKENGLLIGLLKCERGVGDMNVPDYFVSPYEFRQFARALGSDRFMATREKYQGDMTMDDRYMLGFLTEMARRHKVLLYSPNLTPETGEQFGTFEVFNDLETLFNRAKDFYSGAQHVAVLPYGGIHFPMLSGFSESVVQ